MDVDVSTILVCKVILKHVKEKYPDHYVYRAPNDTEHEYAKKILDYMEQVVMVKELNPTVDTEGSPPVVPDISDTPPTELPQVVAGEPTLRTPTINVDSTQTQSASPPETTEASAEVEEVEDTHFEATIASPESTQNTSAEIETDDTDFVPTAEYLPDSDKEGTSNTEEKSQPIVTSVADLPKLPESIQKSRISNGHHESTQLAEAGLSPCPKSKRRTIVVEEEKEEQLTSIADLLKCPKLKNKASIVVLRRISKSTDNKLKAKAGRINLQNMDPYELELLKADRYDPYIHSKNRVKESTARPKKKKRKTEDSEEEVALQLLDSDDEEPSSFVLPPPGAHAMNGSSSLPEIEGRLENLSDFEDMEVDVCPDDETRKPADKKKTKSSTSNNKSSQLCITPKVRLDIFETDSEPESQKTVININVKKEKTDLPEEESKRLTSNSGQAGTTSRNSTSLIDDEESDNDLREYDKFLKSKKVREEKTSTPAPKKSTKKVVSDSDDSDFIPTVKKRVLTSKKGVAKKKSEEEGGSSSPIQISDDSDSDFDFKTKKSNKRNRSDLSVDSSEEKDKEKSSKKKQTNSPKKRRRIKAEPVSGESDDASESKAQDSDVEEIEPSPSPKKKTIRRVLSKKELQKTTRQAAREEEERKKRVAEKQKLYNQMFSVETGSGAKFKELVLDFDKETKQPLLSVDQSIVKALKPHQVEGIKFMWESCFESLDAIKANSIGGGCILAHCMGLGKTLQTIGFLHTVMSSKACGTRRALVICPLNTVGNWFNEFRQWCADCDVQPRIHKLWDVKGKKRFSALSDWERLGGVGILHYDSFRTLANSDEKKKGRPTQKELAIIRTSLLDPGPDVVLCDEGHLLKNEKTQQTKAVMKIRTQRRIVLTGTPLQNNLQEYHTMMSFVKPNLLGTKKEFANRFVHPIAQGQARDSDEQDVKLMKRRAHVLHKLLDGCVQRLDYSVLTPYLPPKFEYAISINLSEVQKKLISHYLTNMTTNSKGGVFVSSQLFKDYQAMVKMWTHPFVLTYKKVQEAATTESEAGSLKDFICDENTTDGEATSDDDDGDNSSNSKPAPPSTRSTRSRKGAEEESIAEPLSQPQPEAAWYMQFVESAEDLQKMEMSGKMVVLFEILKTCEEIGDKVLVFSQFLTSLDLIEDFLAEMDNEAQTNKKKDEPVTFPPAASDSVGRWRPNIEYFRIDGSTRTDDRQKSCDIFNTSKATRAKLFLISTKAGGLGINLTGANRVVIFDASWNPSHDLQSIFRVFRFGQTKPCYIYRLLARGTMEEKIYNRQVVKLSLSCRVVDEQQIERHFQFDEIRDMYKFNPMDTTDRPIPIVPKDRLLADLLINQKDWIFSYLEHDSLLENKQEEELTEEERKAAWEEYQYEETAPQQSRAQQYGNDDWNLRMLNALRLRYPLQDNATITQLLMQTRSYFDELYAVHNQMSMAGRDSPRYSELHHKLMAKVADLKAIFGDDVNWATHFQNYQTSKEETHKAAQRALLAKFSAEKKQKEYIDYAQMIRQQQQQIAANQGISGGAAAGLNAGTASMIYRAQLQQLQGQRKPTAPLLSLIGNRPFGNLQRGSNMASHSIRNSTPSATTTGAYPRMPMPDLAQIGNGNLFNSSRTNQRQLNGNPTRMSNNDEPIILPDSPEPTSILPD